MNNPYSCLAELLQKFRSPSICNSKTSKRSVTLSVYSALAFAFIGSGVIHANTVDAIRTSEQQAIPFSYVADGIEYRWGVGNNQIIEGFVFGGRSLSYGAFADRGEVVRDNQALTLAGSL